MDLQVSLDKLRILLRLIIMLILCLTSMTLTSQSTSGKIHGKVIDKEKGSPLPYTTILNQRTLEGTASDENGVFTLINTKIGDSLLISFIGYDDLVWIVESYNNADISLSPESEILDNVVITANSDYLYDIIKKVRRKSYTKELTAKTYVFLEGSVNGKQTEMIEAYYNCTFKDHDIHNFKLKKGRIGLDTISNTYFVNSESSKAVGLISTFTLRKNNPIRSPLSIKKNNLKKSYSLSLENKYNTGKQTVFVIGFSSNIEGEYFNGKLWVNEKHELLKIYLNIENSNSHPFEGFGNIILKPISIQLTKTFTKKRGVNVIDNIHFDYQFEYVSSHGETRKSSNKVYIKAYNFDDSFDYPLFDFSRCLHQDYRDITIRNYDTLFWDRFHEFRLFEKADTIERFIYSNQVNEGLLFKEYAYRGPQLEFPYVSWSKGRISIRPLSYDVLDKKKEQIPFPSDRYKLNHKIYLDVNTFPDTTYYHLDAILDPMGTYYWFDLKEEDYDYINMYFDIVEIYKRKLDEELKTIEDYDYKLVKTLYDKYTKKLNRKLKKFTKQSMRCRAVNSTREWNDYIDDHLGIDNLRTMHY